MSARTPRRDLGMPAVDSTNVLNYDACGLTCGTIKPIVLDVKVQISISVIRLSRVTNTPRLRWVRLGHTDFIGGSLPKGFAR
jgi:hypothetical protein